MAWLLLDGFALIIGFALGGLLLWLIAGRGCFSAAFGWCALILALCVRVGCVFVCFVSGKLVFLL